MTVDVERLAEAGKRCVKNMDGEDLAALKLCLLSAGALMGLSLKSRAARRIAGLGCTLLTAGLALPLAVRYLDELDQTPVVPSPLEEEREE